MRSLVRIAGVALVVVMLVQGCSGTLIESGRLPLNARDEPYAKNPYQALEASGELRIHMPNGGWTAGTAFCVWTSEVESAWITCAHVASRYRGEGYIANLKVLVPVDGKLQPVPEVVERFVVHPAWVNNLSNDSDIAVLWIKRPSKYIVRLAKELKVKPGDETYSIGAFGPIDRPVITIGRINDPALGLDDFAISDTSGGWYGSSGGPLILRATNEAIGVRYKMRNNNADWLFSLRVDLYYDWIQERLRE